MLIRKDWPSVASVALSVGEFIAGKDKKIVEMEEQRGSRRGALFAGAAIQ